MPLIEIICTMLCPSDRHQYRLWAQKGHLLYFIFKIAPYIIACGKRSCLWPYNYPLDLMPGALESLAYIMATIISSVHFAFDTELISPLDALENNNQKFWAYQGYFITTIATETPSFILACCTITHTHAWCQNGYTNKRMDYHKIKPPFSTCYNVILLMTGRGVRITHAFGVYSYTFNSESVK